MGINANIIENEHQNLPHYMQGLNSPIKERLELGQTYWFAHETSPKAMKVKTQLTQSKKNALFNRLTYEPYYDKAKHHMNRTTSKFQIKTQNPKPLSKP